MITIEKLQPEKTFLKVIVYGDPGAGKTWFAGSAHFDERSSPALLIDFEGGAVGAPAGVEVARLSGIDDLVQLIDWLYTDENKYKTIILDSLSEIYVDGLYNSIDNRLDEPRSARRVSPFLVQQGDYGIASMRTRFLATKLRNLPAHVIFTCLAKDALDPLQGEIKKLSLPGKLSDEIPGLVDVVGCLAPIDVDEGGEVVQKRALLLKNYPVQTKVRFSPGTVVPDEIVEPTFSDLLDLGGIKKQ